MNSKSVANSPAGRVDAYFPPSTWVGSVVSRLSPRSLQPPAAAFRSACRVPLSKGVSPQKHWLPQAVHFCHSLAPCYPYQRLERHALAPLVASSPSCLGGRIYLQPAVLWCASSTGTVWIPCLSCHWLSRVRHLTVLLSLGQILDFARPVALLVGRMTPSRPGQVGHCRPPQIALSSSLTLTV
jgi:hypothetical protein